MRGLVLVRLGVVVASAAVLLVFYRVVVLSGGDAVPGDLGDGRFNLAVLEHWYRVILGREGWTSPAWFYPVPGVLGYSDALVLLVPSYVGARLLGAEPVAALAATLVLASVLGLVGMLVFLRRCLGLVWPAVLAGAAGFATASALYQSLSVGHFQMIAVEALPWLAILVVLALSSGRRVWAVGAALLLALLMTTSFYVGWFLCVQGLVSAGLLALLAPNHAVRVWLGAQWPALALAAGVLVIGLVPFAWLYLPTLLHSPPRPWADVVRTLPDGLQSFEVRGNALWGPVAEALWPGRLGRGGELGKGLTWGLLATFAVTLGAALGRGWRARGVWGLHSDSGGWDRDHDHDRLVVVLGASVVVCWLLMVQVDGVSLWWAVYCWLPGGHSIRSVFRFNLVLAFSAATVAAVGLHRWWQRGTTPMRSVVVLVVGLIMVEQVNALPGTLSRSRDFAAIEAVPPAPATCRAFVLLPTVPDPVLHRWSRQLGAVLVAQRRDIPTLNGYSGMAPPGWGLFDPTDQGAYHQAVAAWADRYDLWPGLCGLDLDAGRWFPLERDERFAASQSKPASLELKAMPRQRLE